MTEDELIFVSKNYMKLKEVKEKLATLDVNVISKNYKFFEQLKKMIYFALLLIRLLVLIMIF